MNILETKQERLKREAERQAEQQRLEQERIEEQRRRVEEEKQKKHDNFMEQMKVMSKTDSIISVTISDDTPLKQKVLQFFLTNGFTCVQNDVCGTKYTVHYVMTFAKDEMSVKFK